MDKYFTSLDELTSSQELTKPICCDNIENHIKEEVKEEPAQDLDISKNKETISLDSIETSWSKIVENISKKNPKIGIDIILFDAEDYGQPENSDYPIMQDSWCLGSQYWSKNTHKTNYSARYGILLDMVGAKDATFTHEQTSAYYGQNILQNVVQNVLQNIITKFNNKI